MRWEWEWWNTFSSSTSAFSSYSVFPLYSPWIYSLLVLKKYLGVTHLLTYHPILSLMFIWIRTYLNTIFCTIIMSSCLFTPYEVMYDTPFTYKCPLCLFVCTRDWVWYVFLMKMYPISEFIFFLSLFYVFLFKEWYLIS